MAKLCRACGGPVCPVCGGCIGEGECSCLSIHQIAAEDLYKEIADTGAVLGVKEDSDGLCRPLRKRAQQVMEQNAMLLKGCIMAEKYFEALLSPELDDYTVEDIIWTHDELKDAIASARECAV